MENLAFTDIRKLLKDELYSRIENNPSYSLRAFARDLNIDHGTLSQIISGKRTLTLRNYLRMEPSLSITEEQKKSLRQEVCNEYSDFTTYDDQQITTLNKWYHTAILELMDTVDFQSCPQWMAEKLGLRLEEVEEALQLLSNLDMIRQKGGRWYPTENNTSTLKGTQMENLDLAAIVQDVQAQTFQKQIEAFETNPYELMSHYGLTFCLSPDDLPRFREKMLALLREINRMADAETSKKEEVYRLNISLFPYTKRNEFRQ